MNYNLFLESVAFFMLCWAFVLLWRERKNFISSRLITVSLFLFSIGRLSDIFVEISVRHTSDPFIWKRGLFDQWLTNFGNFSDSIGLLCLLIAFFRITNYQHQEQKRIEELESLLPICSWCKRYRTEDGEWKPIEKYLHDSGGPPVTHGICPECAAKERQKYQESRKTPFSTTAGSVNLGA